MPFDGFHVGDKVRIKEGRFGGQTGTLAEITDDGFPCGWSTCVVNIKDAPGGTAVINEFLLEKYDENTGEIMTLNRYEVGNVVMVGGGYRHSRIYHGLEGIITKVLPSDPYWYYAVEGDLWEQYYLVDIKGIGTIQVEENELYRDTSLIGLYKEAVYAGRYKPIGSPIFKTGDVVEFTDQNTGQNRICVVREPVQMELHEAVKYVYRVSPVDSCDEVYTYDAALLEFQYHDAVWRQYFEELINNSLPEWKGELYNYYTCLDDVYYNDYYDMRWKYNAVSGYTDCTIPPQYMHYICTTHHLCNKIHAILTVHGNDSVIMKKLNIDENAMRKIIYSISDKIYIRNMQESGNDEYANKNYKFNMMELSFLSLIDKLDNPVDSARDYFPIEMTSLEIMRAIREAYNTARKISDRKLQRVRDKRILSPMHNEDIVEPVDGRILYEGESKHGLTIRFWYNFDLGLIETAYPTEMNNNAKKH
jgi:hypothetical protein